MNTLPPPPSVFRRRTHGGGSILRLHPALASYWRSLLAMAVVFLVWRAEKDVIDTLLEHLGFAQRMSVAGLVLVWAPLVLRILYHRITHVFELEDGRLLRSRLGLIARQTQEFVLSGRVQVEINQSVIGRLLGFGTVTFWTGDVAGRLEWTDVARPEEIRRYLNALRRGTDAGAAVDNSTGMSDPARAQARSPSTAGPGVSSPGVVPAGVRFVDQVVVVPPISYGFSHSGRLRGLFESRPYSWVERGTPIAVYAIAVPRVDVSVFGLLFGSVERAVVVRSPATGLILHSSFGFGDIAAFEGSASAGWERPAGAFSILVPDGEPKAESGAYLFAEVCRLAREQSRYFFRPSRLWSKGPFAPEEFSDLLGRQSAVQCRVVPAAANFEAYFEEAARKLPALAPLLADLRSARESTQP